MNLKTVLLLGACVPFGPALALVGDGSPTDNTVRLSCTIDRLRTELTAEGAKYLSGGTCVRYQGNTEFYRFAWEGEGAYSVKTGQTREGLRLTGVGAHVAGHQATGRTVATFTCELDPWLHAGAACTQTRTYVNGSFTDQQLLDKFQNIKSPYTAEINALTRDGLFKQHAAARAKYEEEQRRLAELQRQKAIADASNQTLRSPAASPTRSGPGGTGGASITSDGGTGTGTVSSALKLQGALEQQRQAKAATPGAASQTSVAGRFAGTATAAAPSQPASPPAGTGGGATVTREPPDLVEPRPNAVVQGVLRVRADIAILLGLPQLSYVELTAMSPTSTTGPTLPPSQRQFTREMTTQDLSQGASIAMPAGAAASGKWSVRARYGSGSGWGRPVIFEYRALPDVSQQVPAKGGDQLERQALNPQPLPPKTAAGASVQYDQSALNPQPLPPKEAFAKPLRTSPVERQGLNPQPLPPRDISAPATAFQR